MQPALLYLVPCTLGLIVMLAHQRGDLPKMWDGIENRPPAVCGSKRVGALWEAFACSWCFQRDPRAQQPVHPIKLCVCCCI